MKSDSLDPAVAEAYLERTLQAQANAVVLDADADTVFIEVEGVRYRELINPHSLLFTNEVNKPAVNAWVRGFGGVYSTVRRAIAPPTSTTAHRWAFMPAAVRWFGVVTAAPAARCRAA